MSELPLIVVAKGAFTEFGDLQAQFASDAILEERDIGTDAQGLAAALVGARGLAVTLHPLRASHLKAMSGIEVVGRAGIGLDSIDLEEAANSGIAVIHQPEYATAEVATHAVAMLLASQRKLKEADSLARKDWVGHDGLAPVFALDEAAVGVVGCGRIGAAVIERLRPFVGELLVFDPFLESAPNGTRRVDDLLELMSECRAVTLHLPLAPNTRGLVGRTELAALPAGSILVNVSRGGIVDEDALSEALESGHLGAAALDVLADEPPRSDHPLLHAPNVLLSAHMAWYSEASERRLKHQTIADVIAYLSGNRSLTGRLAVDPSDTR